eukprot:PhF_6_TR38041/c0_g1_i2/m.56765
MPVNFTPSADASVMSQSVFTEPCSAAAVAIGGLAVVTQHFPEKFVHPRYLGKTYFTFPVKKLLLPGLGTVATGYVFAGALISDGELVRGHVLSLVCSGSMVLWGAPNAHISLAYPFVALCAGLFGYLYSYKRIQVLTDGAPLYQKGDFSEFMASWKS